MCSDDVMLKVEHVSKCFEMYEKPLHRLYQTLCAGRKKFYREFWALNDISFEVRKGECVGIVGRNGAGKSTLLQIITGTLQPSGGTVSAKGRIAALLELGSGFNPEFTGRENVYMNAAILGLSPAEIKEKYQEIVDFADIGDFIEQPVKTYSSGMMVRLAFAVSAYVDADILIIDEALAVGDVAFQAKCALRIRKLLEKQCTILFVSHDSLAVKSYCDRCIYLEDKRIRRIGPAAAVVDEYLADVKERTIAEQRQMLSAGMNANEFVKPELEEGERRSSDHAYLDDPDFDKRVRDFRSGTGDARVRSVRIFDSDNQERYVFKFDEEVKIQIDFEFVRDCRLGVNYHIKDNKGIVILGTGVERELDGTISGKAGEKYSVVFTTRLPMEWGDYNILVVLYTRISERPPSLYHDWVENSAIFKMETDPDLLIYNKVYIKNSCRVIGASE